MSCARSQLMVNLNVPATLDGDGNPIPLIEEYSIDDRDAYYCSGCFDVFDDYADALKHLSKEDTD